MTYSYHAIPDLASKHGSQVDLIGCTYTGQVNISTLYQLIPCVFMVLHATI